MNYFCTERPSEPREHLDAVRTTHTSARLAQVKSALTEGGELPRRGERAAGRGGGRGRAGGANEEIFSPSTAFYSETNACPYYARFVLA